MVVKHFCPRIQRKYARLVWLDAVFGKAFTYNVDTGIGVGQYEYGFVFGRYTGCHCGYKLSFATACRKYN